MEWFSIVLEPRSGSSGGVAVSIRMHFDNMKEAIRWVSRHWGKGGEDA